MSRLTGAAFGQTWVSLDGSQPGTPAEIVFDAQASSPGQSVIDLYIHGYWSTPRVGADNRAYQQIELPGLPDAHEVGSPELPVFRFDLGIVTGAPQVVLTSADALEQVLTQAFLPWPHPIPSLPDSQNTPEQFARDEAIYSSTADFPAGAGRAQNPATRGVGTLDLAEVETYPFRWNASGILTIDRHVRYTLLHAGPPSTVQAGSKMEATSALAGLLNAPVVEPWLVWDTTRYNGYYLFIYPTLDEAAITPLAEQKKKHGFTVTMQRFEKIGSGSCAEIRQFIELWYASTPRPAEHYCLLAGDVEFIPMCASPHQPPPVDGTELGDDLYGDADGDGVDDLGKEVYIGRLSYHSRPYLASQVARILNYEDHPTGLQSYSTATLIAHQGPPPDTRFELNQEAVRTSTYSDVTPTFETLYGSMPGVGNAGIVDAFGRVGVISYSGHGSPAIWSGWNTGVPPASAFTNENVAALTNGPVTPIVWSLACETGDLTRVECLIEAMMARGANGAVATYGATRVSYIVGNLVTNSSLFKAIFGLGITKHGLAIRYAERECTKIDREANAWMYLLLGDPAMQIRRHDVADPRAVDWTVERASMIPASCDGCMFPVRILTPLGTPAPGVQISLWKSDPSGGGSPVPGGAVALAGALGSGDQVLTNLYTGQDGRATFQLPALTIGTMYVTATDDDANVKQDSVLVSDPSAVAQSGGSAPIRFRIVPSVTGAEARLEFGRELDRDAIVTLMDVGGRKVREWRTRQGTSALPWNGRDGRGREVANGVYFARLQLGPRFSTARIVVVR